MSLSTQLQHPAFTLTLLYNLIIITFRSSLLSQRAVFLSHNSNARAKALSHPRISIPACSSKKKIRSIAPNNSLQADTVCVLSHHFLTHFSRFSLAFLPLPVSFAWKLFFFRPGGKSIQSCMTRKIVKTVDKPKSVHALTATKQDDVECWGRTLVTSCFYVENTFTTEYNTGILDTETTLRIHGTTPSFTAKSFSRSSGA